MTNTFNATKSVAEECVDGYEQRLASAGQFATMLTRNISGRVIPESRLIVAVLRQAAEDAQAEWRKFLRSYVPKSAVNEGKHQAPIEPSEFLRAAPIRFWTSGGMSVYAELVGLDPVFVYEQFAKHLGIDLKAASHANVGDAQAGLAKSAQRVWELCTQVAKDSKRPVAPECAAVARRARKRASAESGGVA